MKLARLSLVVASLLFCGAAAAQYQWLDLNGRRVFSDRPPPAEIPEKNILVQPSGRVPIAPPTGATQPDVEGPGEETASAVPEPTVATVDPELEKKKREADAAEAAKEKAAAEQQAAARAENCRRARSAVATLESGQRMARMNEKGEREVLNDAQRAAELERARGIMNSSCD